MIPRHTFVFLAWVSGLFGTWLMGCETYDPPPEVSLVPKTGSYAPGTPIKMVFSEPIQSQTLEVRIWKNVKDAENNLIRDDGPLLDTCTVASSPCGDGNVLTVAEDGLSAELLLNPETIGKADIPMMLEVSSALTDVGGAQRGISAWYDIKFSYTECPEDAPPVQFESGVYMLFGQTKEPVPAVLRLMTDFKMRDDGYFLFAGAEVDPINDDLPEETTDPDLLQIDTQESGWTVFGSGRICNIGGQRRINTDPFEVNLVVLGIGIHLHQVRIQGEVLKDENQHDYIDALLIYDALTLSFGHRDTDYEGSNAPLSGDYVPPEKVPEGTPQVCGDVCGGVKLGLCEPPEGFPDPSYCE